MGKEIPIKHNNIPQFILTLLEQRGVKEEKEIEQFLYPKLSNMRKPNEMHNAKQAAELVAQYMENDLQIIIWGDYDVDGTTGTALLVNFFREIGVAVKWHIPNRLTDGYGLNTRWLKKNIDNFVSKKFLIITVDSGISNHEEIDEIIALGGDVIVTDHHSIPEKGLPNCIVINPKQQECGFHNDYLAGVGVAFYLAAAIKNYIKKKQAYNDIKAVQLKKYLAFVAIGTVADMVPITPLNRILIRAGMEELQNPQFIGLTSLLKQSEIHRNISSEDIGFLIGPKINAAGRLGNSQIVVKLLTSQDDKDSHIMAKELDDLNKQRKVICENDTEVALIQISPETIQNKEICIVSGNFHFGVAGIVASKLVEKFSLPAFVLAKCPNKALYHGSGRSVTGVNLVALLEQCSDILERFGGHNMAAGLTIKEKNIQEFNNRISDIIQKEQQHKKIAVEKHYDVPCSINTVMSKSGLYFLSLLEPFGQGNPQPKFLDKQSIIIDSKQVGRTREHLNITLRGDNCIYRGIGFGLGKYKNDVQEQPYRQLVYSITKNRYRGTESWQVRALSF